MRKTAGICNFLFIFINLDLELVVVGVDSVEKSRKGLKCPKKQMIDELKFSGERCSKSVEKIRAEKSINIGVEK